MCVCVCVCVCGGGGGGGGAGRGVEGGEGGSVEHLLTQNFILENGNFFYKT